MTTIAYSAKHKMLAADRRITLNGFNIGQITKIARNKGVLAGAAGTGSLCHRFCAWVRLGCVGDPPLMGEGSGEERIEGIGVLFTKNDPELAIEFSWAGLQLSRAPFHAYGSGMELALGAMTAGATPEEAVYAAMQIDTRSGNGIDVLTL
jgi:hypothetical protein